VSAFEETGAAEPKRSHMYRALVRDAFLQVLDNTVFKVLLALVLVMVALTFVIGFREDGIHLLFGLAVYDYDWFLRSFGFFFGAIGGSNVNETIVQSLQDLFTTTIGGTFGALFAVVATSFFLPRMLERGAADTLFSKPVSRGTLVLSRYVASLIFVSLLTVTLVVGMYLGFAVSSGYANVEFLWSGPMLVYLFVILSAFSTFWGAMTRSSVATLLLTVLSWWGCAGVHLAWLAWDFFDFLEARDSVELTERGERELLTDDEQRQAAEDEPGPVLAAFLQGLRFGVDTAHYVLPKTGDAPALTQLVRKTLHGETRELLGGIALRGSMLQVYEQADGTIVVASVGGDEASFPDGRGTDIEIGGMRPVYLRVEEDDEMRAWSVVSRDDRSARRDYERALEDGGPVDASWPPTWTSEVEVVPPDEIDFGLEDPVSYKERRFTWSEPALGHNPIFSLLSSLLSSAVLVLLAIWRVRRIDF